MTTRGIWINDENPCYEVELNMPDDAGGLELRELIQLDLSDNLTSLIVSMNEHHVIVIAKPIKTIAS